MSSGSDFRLGGGTKHDAGKPEIALIDSEFIEGVAAVMTFGKRKYAANNWRKGLEVTRTISASLRHIFAYLRGEDTDPESGLSHLYHAACGLQFAAWMAKHRPELDDRYREEEQGSIKTEYDSERCALVRKYTP